MTLEKKANHFLQTDIHCDNDGKRLGKPWGYYKIELVKQYPWFSLSWFRTFFGDRPVLRFCDLHCFSEWCVKMGEEARSTQSGSR